MRRVASVNTINRLTKVQVRPTRPKSRRLGQLLRG